MKDRNKTLHIFLPRTLRDPALQDAVNLGNMERNLRQVLSTAWNTKNPLGNREDGVENEELDDHKETTEYFMRNW